jgi:hypothetical protein
MQQKCLKRAWRLSTPTSLGGDEHEDGVMPAALLKQYFDQRLKATKGLPR